MKRMTLYVANSMLAIMKEEFKDAGIDIVENLPMPLDDTKLQGLDISHVYFDDLQQMPSDSKQDKYWLQGKGTNGKRKRNPNRWK